MLVSSPRCVITQVDQNQKNAKKLYVTFADEQGSMTFETEVLDYAQALQARLLPVSLEMTVRPYEYAGKQRLEAIQVSIKAIK